MPGGHTTFIWSGPVQAPMANEIDRAFKQHKHQSQRIVLMINSGGGSVAEGKRAINVLRWIKATHRLDTAVAAGKVCASMCVWIYAQGQTRYAASASLWLFHEVSRSDAKTKLVYELDSRAFQQLIDDYFVPAGVSRNWIAEMLRHTYGKDHWQTGEMLLRNRSGLAHKPLSDDKDRKVYPRTASRNDAGSQSAVQP